MQNWKYNNIVIYDLKDILKINPNSIGFVYRMNLYDIKSGELKHSYIGKKNLFTKRKRKFGKREIAKMKDKRAKKYEYVIKESDWQNYTSSNNFIKENYKKYNLERVILSLYDNDSDLRFQEAKQIICSGAMEGNLFLNENVRITKFKKNEVK